MLEAAYLKPGDDLLDIAAGTGDQSRQAAQLVGPEGSILATDISQEMLTVAARLAEQEGLNNLTIRVMNAEHLDLPANRYDAVISRLGLMLIPDQQQALLEIRRVLKPGGRLSALVWSKPERNPLFTPYVTLVNTSWEAEHRQEKASDPFSLADAAFFASRLSEAGFREVQVQIIPLTFHFPSFEALTTWWGTPFKETQQQLDPTSRQRVQEEVHQAVRPFEGSQGIVAPAELLLGTAMK
jgi:ubiquinone/menaquinone biosynthesis C-methylase UbiE